MTLTNEYQYIATSSEFYGHGTPQNYYRYRLILHAKFEQVAGATYRVWLRTYMVTVTQTPFSTASDGDVESYASAGGVKAFSKTTGPDSSSWGTSVAGDGTTYSNGILLGEGYTDIDGSDGAAHSVELLGYWKKVSYTSSGAYAGIPYHNTVAQASATVTLPALAVASTISADNGYFGDVIPITISRFDSIYTHTITAACAGVSETILDNGTAYPTVNWTPAVSKYAPKITSSMSANCVLTCSTYRYGVLVGTRTTNITLTLKAAEVKPSTAITVEDAAGYFAKYGKYVATKSKLKISLTNTLLYGATVKAVSIAANGATFSTNPATTNELLSASYNTVTAQIQDSRSQMSDQVSVALDVLPYSPPAINSFSVHRCNNDGSANDEGAYCRIDFDVSISPLDDINSRALTVKYKAVSAEEYTSGSISLSAYAVTGSYLFAADTEQSFDVRLELTDDFSTSTIQTILSTASTTIALRPGGLGVGFGKVPEHDYSIETAANWTIRIGERTLLDYLHPVGSVYISSQPTDPGTLFGGTWTRIKDTFILAAGDSYAIGAAGGASTVTLTENQIPAHAHTFKNGSHTWLWGIKSGLTTPVIAVGANASAQYGSSNELITDQGVWNGTNNTGGGQSHNNMPPYIARYVWERTA